MIVQPITTSPILTSFQSSITISESIKISPITQSKCCGEGCKKKLTLTDFPCKCNKKFCSVHRAAEAHSCTYDYKAQHNKELLKTMSEPVSSRRVEII